MPAKKKQKLGEKDKGKGTAEKVTNDEEAKEDTKRKISELEKEKSELEKEKSELETEKSEVKKKINEVEKKINEVEAALQGGKPYLGKTNVTGTPFLQEQLKWLEDRHGTLQEQLKSLEDRHGTLEGVHKSLEDRHGTLQEQLKSLQDVDKSLQDRIWILQDERHASASGPSPRLAWYPVNDSFMTFLANLQGTPQKLGSDVEVLRNATLLTDDTPSDLVLRKSVRELWEAVHLSPDDKILVIGNPGIGKSTSMQYLLRLLLQGKTKCIIWQDVNGECIYRFLLSSDHYEVTTCPGSSLSVAFELKDSETWCLVDPGDETRPQPMRCNAKVVLASPPDARHYAEWFKDGKTFGAVMPTWTLNELEAARGHFNARIDKDTLKKRYEQIGGLPRFLFAGGVSFKIYIAKVKHAIENATKEHLFEVDPSPVYDKREKPLCTLFAMLPKQYLLFTLLPHSDWIVSEIADQMFMAFEATRTKKGVTETLGTLWEYWVMNFLTGKLTTRVEGFTITEQGKPTKKIPADALARLCPPSGTPKCRAWTQAEFTERTAKGGSVVHAPEGYPVLDGVWETIAYQATTGEHQLAPSKKSLAEFQSKPYGKVMVFVVPVVRKGYFTVSLPPGVSAWPKGLITYVLFLG